MALGVLEKRFKHHHHHHHVQNVGARNPLLFMVYYHRDNCERCKLGLAPVSFTSRFLDLTLSSVDLPQGACM